MSVPNADVAGLCLALWRFERMHAQWDKRYPEPHKIPFSLISHTADLPTLKGYIDDFERIVEALELRPSRDRLRKIALRFEDSNTTVGRLGSELRTLIEATIDELYRRTFFEVPNERLPFLSGPAKFFGTAWSAFPSAQENMTSACRCYALGEDTASVFHAMGVLQRGLESLARHLNVQFPTPVDTLQSQQIIDKLDSELGGQTRLVAQKSKSQGKDDELKFYANASLQFRYFKDAWRNDTAHFRESYDSDEARTVLTHVKNFMITLSQRIKETP